MRLFPVRGALEETQMVTSHFVRRLLRLGTMLGSSLVLLAVHFSCAQKKAAAVTRSFVRLVNEFELLFCCAFTWCILVLTAAQCHAIFKCNDFSNICLRKGILTRGPSSFEAVPLCSHYCRESFSVHLLAGCSSGGTFLAKAAERLGQNATRNAASTFASSY